MTQPNVLLICTDHWPGPLIGEMAHERILTPTLNALAAKYIVMARHCSSPDAIVMVSLDTCPPNACGK